MIKKNILTVIIFVVLTMSLTSCGNSKKTYTNDEFNFEISYDKGWNIKEDSQDYVVDIVYGDGDVADLGILVEDVSNSEKTLEEYRNLYSQNLKDGIINVQNVTIDGNEGYWVTASETTGELDIDNSSFGDLEKDLIITKNDKFLYVFYYTANGKENYEQYTDKIDEMLASFKIK